MGGMAVFELRQYTLHPGKREALVRLFEEHFVEGQEEHGIEVLGQFHDLCHPDRFVWIRSFADMAARTEALQGFYGGPIWSEHAAAANATMIDSDNVLLLRPAGEGVAFRHDPRDRVDRADPARAGGLVVATVYSFDAPVDPAFTSWFREVAVPTLAAAGTRVLAQLVTESTPNGFPRLPVRERENVFVWLAAYADGLAQEAAHSRLEAMPEWGSQVEASLRALTKGEPERLFLAPTRRSSLRYTPSAGY